MATYTVRSELGRGGMGIVYRATQEPLGRDVALKVLQADLADNREHCARFIREIKLLMKVEHPNIIKVYDCGENENGWFYAMEMLDAQPLDVISRRAGPMDPRRAFKLLHQAADALVHCHGLGLIHRDIKLSNMMVNAKDHLTLMDFGLARMEGGTVMTAAGKVVGTPRYVSPEVLLGKPATPAADVYAMGICMHELLDGWPAFTADSLRDLMRMILQDGPTDIATLHPQLPPEIPALVRRLVARDPMERPTCAALKEELARLVAMLTGASSWSPSTEMSTAQAFEALGAATPGAAAAEGAAGPAGSAGLTGTDAAGASRAARASGTTGAAGGKPASADAIAPGAAGSRVGATDTRSRSTARIPAGRVGLGGMGEGGGPNLGEPVGAPGSRSRSTGRIRASIPTVPSRAVSSTVVTPPGAAGARGRSRWVLPGIAAAAVMIASLAVVLVRRPSSTAASSSASASGGPIRAGAGAGFQVEPLPPTRARVHLTGAIPSGGAMAVEAVESSKTVSRASIDPGSASARLGGLLPGHTYALRLVAGDRPVQGYAARLAMPRRLRNWMQWSPSDDHVGVNVALGEATDVELSILRSSDGRVVSAMTSGPVRHFFHVIRGLHPETSYEIRLRSLDTDRYISSLPVKFKTRLAGQRRRIERLIALLGRPLVDVEAADQLGDAADPDFVTGVCEAIANPTLALDDTTLEQLLRGLECCSNPAAIPTLLKVLDGAPAPAIRARAMSALGRMQVPSSFDAIARQGPLLAPVNPAIVTYVVSLVRCDLDRATALFREIASNPHGRKLFERLAAEEGLVQTRDDSLAPDVTRMGLADPEPRVLTWAANKMATVGGPECRKGILKILEALASRPPAQDLSPLFSALQGVSRACGPDAIAAVLPFTAVGRPAPVREAAVRAVAIVADVSAVPRLLGWLDDADVNLRRYAALGLGRLKATQAVMPLVTRLSDHATSLGRFPRALGMIGDKRAVDPLLTLAVQSLPARAGTAATPIELDRAEALWALGCLGDRRAVAPLIQALAETSPWIRLRAAQALGRIGARRAADALAKMAAGAPEPPVKDAARKAMESIRNGKPGEGVEVLVDPILDLTRTGIHVEPGETVRFEPHGAWASDPSSSPVGPGGENGMVDGFHRLTVFSVVGYGGAVEVGAGGAPTFDDSGELRLWAHTAPLQDAIGFVSVWLRDD